MAFTHPHILYFLFALLIPLIVHLFNFRRYRTIYFSNTHLLKTIEQEDYKTKRLKQILALIARIICLSAIIIAFAGPYISNDDFVGNEDERLCGIYIDNSMSMSAQTDGVPLIEIARSKAKEIINSMKLSEKFVLITNDCNPSNELPMNGLAADAQINDIQLSLLPLTTNDVIESFNRIKNNYGYKNGLLFLISDFQRNGIELSPSTDSLNTIVLAQLSSEDINVYVDSVWMTTPIIQKGMENEIVARVVNEGESDIKGFPVFLLLNGTMSGTKNVDIDKKSFIDVNFQFLPDSKGVYYGEVYIDDYPLSYDDHLYFTIEVSNTIKVLELVDNTQQTDNNRLFSNDPLFDYHKQNVYSIDNNSLSDFQFIIVDSEKNINETMQQTLLSFAQGGGSVLVCLSDLNQLQTMMNALQLSVGECDTNELRVDFVNTKNSFFSDMIVSLPDNADLPTIKKHTSLFGRGVNGNSILLRLQNGDPLALQNHYGNGNVFVFTSSFNEEYSNFVSKSLYVPMMYKMAFLSSQSNKLYNIVEQNLLIDMPRTIDPKEKAVIEGSDYESVLMIENKFMNNKLRLSERVPSQGLYQIIQNGNIVAIIAFNNNRSESKMCFAEEQDLVSVFRDNGFDKVTILQTADKSSGDMPNIFDERKMLWTYFIIISLVAIAAEILILRFVKK